MLGLDRGGAVGGLVQLEEVGRNRLQHISRICRCHQAVFGCDKCVYHSSECPEGVHRPSHIFSLTCGVCLEKKPVQVGCVPS